MARDPGARDEHWPISKAKDPGACDPRVFEDWSDRAPQLPFWFRQVQAGPHKNFHYLVGDPGTRKALVVDPAFELDLLWSLAEEEGYTITRALFTHGHWDHVGGAEECARRGVRELVIHERGASHPKLKAAASGGATVRQVGDGDRLDADGLPVEVLWTPGHQPEASCYLVGPPGGPRVLFGGDTLFIGSCGRTDFPGGDTDAMFHSMVRLRNLAAAGVVHVMPGHHYADAPHRLLADEARDNPALSTTDPVAFGQLACLTD